MLRNINFQVKGMHCNSCVTLITMELSEVPGVTGIMVDLKTGRGSATLTDENLDTSEVLSAIERAGYSASIVES